MKSKFRYFKLFDLVTVGYFLILSLLIFIFKSNLQNWDIHFLKHFGYIVLILILIPILDTYKHIKMVHFFRYWYPVMALTFIYWDLGNYIHLIFSGEYDYIIINLEKMVFGELPNVVVQKIYNPVLNEIMQIGYAIYWFLIPVSAFILYFKKKYDELEQLLFMTFFAFYVCYIIFILFPVSGPRFNLVAYFTVPYQGLFLTPVFRNLVENAGLRGAAFPSSHVAVSLVIFRYFRRVEPEIAYRIFLPAVIMLSLATVYGRYHYLTDMLAGLLFGQLIYSFLSRLLFR